MSKAELKAYYEMPKPFYDIATGIGSTIWPPDLALDEVTSLMEGGAKQFSVTQVQMTQYAFDCLPHEDEDYEEEAERLEKLHTEHDAFYAEQRRALDTLKLPTLWEGVQ